MFLFCGRTRQNFVLQDNSKTNPLSGGMRWAQWGSAIKRDFKTIRQDKTKKFYMGAVSPKKKLYYSHITTQIVFEPPLFFVLLSCSLERTYPPPARSLPRPTRLSSSRRLSTPDNGRDYTDRPPSSRPLSTPDNGRYRGSNVL